ncbi:MAG: hypothetical protein MZW92_53420 [Comamonadaceae bacterium]|nr:hypothetical protein [Comamonadaceae bacterium]
MVEDLLTVAVLLAAADRLRLRAGAAAQTAGAALGLAVAQGRSAWSPPSSCWAAG